MITQVNETNSAKYEKLFAKASEALGDFTIRSIEEYFQKIQDLAERDLKYTILPLDEPHFKIDANNRTIEVPSAFKKSGIGVQGDQVAEILYFKINRYYDATDLDTKTIVFQWKTPSGQTFLRGSYIKDIESEPGYIIFGCPVDKELTSESGVLQLSVSFLGLGADNNINYNFNTLTTNVMLNPGLNLSYSSDEYEQALEINKMIIGNLVNSSASVSQAKEPIILLNLQEGTYYLDNLNNLIKVFAISPDAGEIEYVLEKDNKSVEDAVWNSSYTLTQDTTVKNYKTYYEFKDGEYQEYTQLSNNINPFSLGLYERCAETEITTFGKYKVQIKNNVGHKNEEEEGPGQQIYTNSAYSKTITIPEPKQPTISDDNDFKGYILKASSSVELSPKIDIGEDSNHGAILSYQWYEKTSEDEYIKISEATTPFYSSIWNEVEANDTENEYKKEYYIEVTNTLHNGTSVKDNKDNLYMVTYPASNFKEESTKFSGTCAANKSVEILYDLVNSKRSSEVTYEWCVTNTEDFNWNSAEILGREKTFLIPENTGGRHLSCKITNKYNNNIQTIIISQVIASS